METTHATRWRVLMLLTAITVSVATGATRMAGAEDVGAAGTGVRGYIDPHTGRPGVPPPGVTAPSVDAAGRRSAPRLVEVPSTGPAGGVMVNTKGFGADVVATTDGTGTGTLRCDPHPPEPVAGQNCTHE